MPMSMACTASALPVAGSRLSRPVSPSFLRIAAPRVGPARSVAAHRVSPVASSMFEAPSSRVGESPEQTKARRLAESQRLMQRSQPVSTQEELDAFLSEAGDKLVFLSVESTEECDLGDNPDAWAVQRFVTDDPMAPCLQMKDTLMRVARECDDAVFLTLTVTEGHSKEWELARELGVTRFPTFQYYMSNELVWEHVGAGSQAGESIGQGMLYYAGQAAGGSHVDEFITQVKNRQSFQEFLELCAMPQTNQFGADINVPCEKQLAVLDVSFLKDSPGCVHIYPAVLALAKNTAGACRWARLAGDSGPEAAALMKELNVTEVPTFLFFNENREVGRYSGTDRYALMNTVIAIQKEEGIKLPDRKPRKRIPIAEAKRIAEARRAQDRANQWH